MYVPLAIVLGAGPTGSRSRAVMGAAFGLFGDDLRERLMLGDTGANVIGAVLGLAVVLGTSETTRLVVMLALVVAERRGRAGVVQQGHRAGRRRSTAFDRAGRKPSPSTNPST